MSNRSTRRERSRIKPPREVVLPEYARAALDMLTVCGESPDVVARALVDHGAEFVMWAISLPRADPRWRLVSAVIRAIQVLRYTFVAQPFPRR
jgi:hypothetical protein